jgi:hypothetical protein
MASTRAAADAWRIEIFQRGCGMGESYDAPGPALLAGESAARSVTARVGPRQKMTMIR